MNNERPQSYKNKLVELEEKLATGEKEPEDRIQKQFSLAFSMYRKYEKNN